MEEQQSTIQETLDSFMETMKAQDVENYFLISASKSGEVHFSFNGNILELLSSSLEYLFNKDPELARKAIIHLMNFAGEWWQLNTKDEGKVLH